MTFKERLEQLLTELLTTQDAYLKANLKRYETPDKFHKARMDWVYASNEHHRFSTSVVKNNRNLDDEIMELGEMFN